MRSVNEGRGTNGAKALLRPPFQSVSPGQSYDMEIVLGWMLLGVSVLCVADGEMGKQTPSIEATPSQSPTTVTPVVRPSNPTTPNPSTPNPITGVPSETNSSSPQPTTQGTVTTTARRSPCKCVEGSCLCCTGYILSRFNFTTQNKACLKVEYEPDEFEFNVKLLFNNRQLYQRRISGKNPQPICLPIRRIISINACVKFSNVYTIGRNLHACIDFKGDWNDEIELFAVSFECIRLGADGVALVRPEDGGGLPIPIHQPNTQVEDYDDSARAEDLLEYDEDERSGFILDDD